MGVHVWRINRTGIHLVKSYGGKQITTNISLTKYITIQKDKTWVVNRGLSDSIKSRVNWTGNVTEHGCQVVFILRNVTKSDEISTYGCTAEVNGDENRSGPIKLVLYGKNANSYPSDVQANSYPHCSTLGEVVVTPPPPPPPPPSATLRF